MNTQGIPPAHMCVGIIPLSAGAPDTAEYQPTPSYPCPWCAVPRVNQRLHSRRPFHRLAVALVNSDFNLLESWRATWESVRPPAQFLVTPAVCLPPGSELPRSLPVALNRLRTGIGRFGTCLYHWGMLNTPKCICGPEEQSANHTL